MGRPIHKGEMRTIGEQEFTAPKLGKLEIHMAEGGDLWLGANSTEFNDALVDMQGPGSHGRTSRAGCGLSILPEGEGDGEEPTRLVNLRNV